MDGETELDYQEIAVVHESAPEARNGRGFRYRFRVSHNDKGRKPLVICHAREKWAGNFWRDRDGLPEDVPGCVKREVVDVLPYDRHEINFGPEGESE
jgi:hypothetical protein